jgi:hypothetical protein
VRARAAIKLVAGPQCRHRIAASHQWLRNSGLENLIAYDE